MYGWSIVHCLPVALAESAVGGHRHRDSRGDGSRAGRGRPDFARVEVLPVDAGFFRLYRLSPE